MIDNDVYETERSLVRTNKVCKFISVVMKVVFALLCIWWLISIGTMIYSLLNPGVLENVGLVNPIAVFIYVVSGVAMAIICITLIAIFSDASEGHSPFTMVQVRRLRRVAVALLAYCILEFALNWSIDLMQPSWVNPTTNGGTATINLFPLVAAAVIFAFSFVFKYGILLQKLSDETI